MNREVLSTKRALAGIVGIALGGCSSPAGTDGGTGGMSATGGLSSSGGTTVVTSGGATQSGSGGMSGGSISSGGSTSSGGLSGTGGHAAGSGAATSGGSSASGGVVSSGGSSAGSSTMGGAGNGGKGGAGGASSGGSNAGGASSGGANTAGTFSGTCTASKPANANASGSGPHKVTVELNSDPGIKEGTIFRPTDLGGTEKYPIFVWGEGGCSQDGMSNSASMGEIASHGYFVIADGTPKSTASNRPMTSDIVGMAKPLIAYIDWAVAENEKPCSAYYHSLDTTKIASNGFSCGGLMSEGTAGDPRMTTWGINSSGLTGANQAFYKTVHTPVLIVLGGTDDIAYENGERDYDNISGVPVLLFSKNLGHGGDLFSSRGGDFTKINLAWLNWWLKGDETATGKGFLVGSGCKLCSDSAWEVKSKNLP